MTLRKIVRDLSLAGLVLGLALKAPAQSRESAPASQNNLITLKFQGGNVGEYVAAVRKASNGANVFVAPEAQDVAVPPIELNSVSVSGALRLLHDRISTFQGRAVQLDYNTFSSGEVDEQPIYTIGAQMGRAAGTMQNRVWSVANILGSDVKAEDLLTAIQTSLELMGKDAPEAQLRFHEATGILIARANVDQLTSIDQVIENVERAAAQRRDRAVSNAMPEEIAKRDEMLQQMRQQIAVLQVQLEEQKKK